MFIETSAKAGYNVKQVRVCVCASRALQSAAVGAAWARLPKVLASSRCSSSLIFEWTLIFSPNLLPAVTSSHNILPRGLLVDFWSRAKVALAAARGHGLLVHFDVITVCVFFPPSCLLVGICGDVWVWVFVRLCAVICDSSQTDNHRGGRTKSKRHECPFYWNECKDRLQCQTGRACARVCVCVWVRVFLVLVLSSHQFLIHTCMSALTVCLNVTSSGGKREVGIIFSSFLPPARSNDFYWSCFHHTAFEVGQGLKNQYLPLELFSTWWYFCCCHICMCIKSILLKYRRPGMMIAHALSSPFEINLNPAFK